MALQPVLHRLEAEFDVAPEKLRAIVELLEAGAPVAFLTRFRHDETGGLGEDRLAEIEERWHFLQDMETRKESILQQAVERGAATDELAETLEATHDQDLLDDIYQSFRPRRRTLGMQAEEKGLGPLALAIHHRTLGGKTLQEAALEYVAADGDLPTPESVLEGVLYILAERYGTDPQLRARLRDELSRGILKATAMAPDRKGAARYKDFFEFEAPVRRIDAQRMLALRRAEREGIIKVELRLPEGREREVFRERFARDLAEDGDPALPAFLDMVFDNAYEHQVRPSCEADIRRRIKEKADRETVRTYARNLRSQLLSPPLGTRPAIAVRATHKTVWMVALAEDGSIAAHRTIHLGQPRSKAKPKQKPESAPPSEPKPTAPPDPVVVADPNPAEAEDAAPAPAAEPAAEPTPAPAAEPTPAAAAEPAPAAQPSPEPVPEPEPADTQAQRPAPCREDAIAALAELIVAHRPAAIAIPHGRRQEFTQQLVAAAMAAAPDVKTFIVPVDEATSTIHATSAAGRKALPGTEVGIRTAVSLGRRLQDPMLELLAMNPRELSLGHGLGDVHQGMLTRQLEGVVASCLASVGVDLNHCTAETLAHLPALGRERARAIVDERKKRGGFRKLADLTSIEGIDEPTFRHAAGFLRILGGDEPLDATAVHPEAYELAGRIAAAEGCTPQELFGRNLKHVELQRFVDADNNRGRVLDTLRSLSSVGRDPRGQLANWSNEGVGSIDDLAPDMHLRGRVTNLTEFGAFVDLGVGHDGLIHISQIPGNRMRDPQRMLAVGEVVQVYVLRVDKQAHRISLSMHRPRHLAEGRSATVGERMSPGNRRRRREAPAPVMNRAARAPEGRRGDRRGAPRRAPGKDAGGRGGRDDRYGGRRSGGGGGGGAPRVITVESGKQIEHSRGLKGELRSLAGLKQLLDTPAADAGEAPPKSEE